MIILRNIWSTLCSVRYSLVIFEADRLSVRRVAKAVSKADYQKAASVPVQPKSPTKTKNLKNNFTEQKKLAESFRASCVTPGRQPDLLLYSMIERGKRKFFFRFLLVHSALLLNDSERSIPIRAAYTNTNGYGPISITIFLYLTITL